MISCHGSEVETSLFPFVRNEGRIRRERAWRRGIGPGIDEEERKVRIDGCGIPHPVPAARDRDDLTQALANCALRSWSVPFVGERGDPIGMFAPLDPLRLINLESGPNHDSRLFHSKVDDQAEIYKLDARRDQRDRFTLHRSRTLGLDSSPLHLRTEIRKERVHPQVPTTLLFLSDISGRPPYGGVVTTGRGVFA
jgi:hypothetical protein